MECKLNDLPRGHMRGHRLLDDIDVYQAIEVAEFRNFWVWKRSMRSINIGKEPQ